MDPVHAVRPKGVRLSADERRTQIVGTAFTMIAEAGLECFRTRDVAERVGINSATLHYYFPTKEDLIRAVGAHLAHRYAQERSPVRAKESRSALAALRQEFEDAAFYRRKRLDMLAVSREFTLRAARDPQVAEVIGTLNQQWRRTLEQILERGIVAGEFRADLDPSAVAMVLTSALWAATVFLGASDREFRAMCRALERWVVKPAPPAKAVRR